VLYGDDAYQYTKSCLEPLEVTNSGWEQLWRCKVCNSYWKMSWNNSQGGFDNGIMTLRRLTLEQVSKLLETDNKHWVSELQEDLDHEGAK